MPSVSLAPCLWFEDEAEEAATFYVGIFPRSRILRVCRYGKAGRDFHGRPLGSVMTVEFELDGHPFTALNAGRNDTFNEAISLQIICDSQGEVDHYWEKLCAGGDPGARQCGWLRDRFGLSWQVIPRGLNDLLASSEDERAERAMRAVLRMDKLDLELIRRAWRGEPVPF